MRVKPLGGIAALLLGVLLLNGEDAPVTVPAFGPRFKEIHERIDALYRYRNGNYPLPDAQLNPFRLAATTPTATPQTPLEPKKTVPTDSDETLLQQAAATLAGGIIRGPDGRAYFSVNQKIYKEGDLLATRAKSGRLTLAVKRVTPTSVTLSLNAAELVVPFAAPRPP